MFLKQCNPAPPPQPGNLGQSLKTFLVDTPGKCSWRLVVRAQGCCEIAYGAQNRPHPRPVSIQPQMSVCSGWETLLWIRKTRSNSRSGRMAAVSGEKLIPTGLAALRAHLHPWTLHCTSGPCRPHPPDWVSSLIWGCGAIERSYDTAPKSVHSVTAAWPWSPLLSLTSCVTLS